VWYSNYPQILMLNIYFSLSGCTDGNVACKNSCTSLHITAKHDIRICSNDEC